MRKTYKSMTAVSALVACLTLIALLGATQAFAAVLVNIPMDTQIDIGRGPAIFTPMADIVTIQPAAPPADPAGFTRCTIQAASWYYGPYIDLYRAGLPYVDMTNPETKVEVDVRYYQDPNNLSRYQDAPIFFRIYSLDDAGNPIAWRDYSAVVQFSGEAWRYPYWRHVVINLAGYSSSGSVVTGGVFDPAKVGRFRFYGTDWHGVPGSDWIDVKNFKIHTDPPAGIVNLWDSGSFEGYTLGNLVGQSGWLDDSTAWNPWGLVQVVADPTGAGKSNVIKFKVSPSANYGYQGAYVPMESGTNNYVDLSWDQYREQFGTNNPCNDNIWFTEDKIDYSGSWGLQWDMDRKFHPVSNSGDPSVALTANAWEHINLRYDFTTHKVTVTKNGASASTGAILDTTRVHMWDFEVESLGATDDEDGPCYVDNLKLATYTPPVVISGKVVDGAGTPVAGAFVGVKDTPNASADAILWCKTDASGNYNTGQVPSGAFYLAAWKPGYKPTADQIVVIDGASQTCNFAFANAQNGINYALRVYGSSASTNNPDSNLDPNFDANNAIDGAWNSRFGSNNTDTGKVSVIPTWLMVDLGQNRTITEADIVWEAARATVYKLQVLPDGADPSVEANWTEATTIYSTTTGGGADLGGYHYGSAIKIPATTGRYWRVYATASVYYLISIYEFQLRGATQVATYKLGDAKSLTPGTSIQVDGLRINALPGAGVPSGVAYAEAADRSGGIRLDTSVANLSGIVEGDAVSVTGIVDELPTHEKYIKAAVNKTASAMALDAVVTNSRSAGDKASMGMFVKLVGKVSNPTADSFTITDGGKSIVVKCGAIDKPAEGDNVKVRGVVSTDGTDPVLYMRNYAADWINADAAYQWLPFMGSYQAVKSFMVLGPFSNGAMDQSTALAYDFIAAADPTQSEGSVRPALGDTVGGLTWKKVDAPTDFLDFNAAFGGSEFKNSTAYAFVYTTLPTAGVVYFGYDDSCVVYMNGVYQFGDSRVGGSSYGQKSIAPLDINNAILIKVVNGSGGWNTVMHLFKAGDLTTDLNQCSYSLDKTSIPGM